LHTLRFGEQRLVKRFPLCVRRSTFFGDDYLWNSRFRRLGHRYCWSIFKLQFVVPVVFKVNSDTWCARVLIEKPRRCFDRVRWRLRFCRVLDVVGVHSRSYSFETVFAKLSHSTANSGTILIVHSRRFVVAQLLATSKSGFHTYLGGRILKRSVCGKEYSCLVLEVTR